MSEFMKKIVYYENILEFKENTKSDLLVTELNNWQLCRTCLLETVAEDVDLEKMCLMDIMEGRFLNVKEMLNKATGFEVSPEEGLPLKVCKDCLNKITTLYYFTKQARKAENIIKRLANKLKTQNKEVTAVSVEKAIREESSTSGQNMKCNKDIATVEIEMDIQNDIEVIHVNDDGGDDGQIEDSENLADSTNHKDIEHEVEMLLKEKEENHSTEDININFYYEEEDAGEEDYLDCDFQEVSEIEAIEEMAKKERNDGEVLIIPDQELGENSYSNDSQQDQLSQCENKIEKASKMEFKHRKPRVKKRHLIIPDQEMGDDYHSNDSLQDQLSKNKNEMEKTSKIGFKHRQPRVKKRLLDDVKCAVCKKIFCRQQDLIKHVRQSHPNSKAFQCRDCDQRFAHMQSLSRHMNTHKDSLIKNECKICSKSFLRFDDFKRHFRIHSGERPYQCELCDKAFKQNGELKAHHMTHFPLTKQFSCDQCERIFQSRNGLFIHRKLHINQTGDKQKIDEQELGNKREVLKYKKNKE